MATLKDLLVSGPSRFVGRIFVNDSTLVTNLNADMLDDHHASYFATASSLGNYVLKTGDTMTGTLKRTYSSSNDTPFLWMDGGDVDNYIWQISSGTSTKQYFGYGLKYIGSGTGVNNLLRLIADNQNSTDITAIGINQSGQVGIGADPSTSFRLHVSGGLLAVTNYSNTLTIGSNNASWTHFTNSSNRSFYFSNTMSVNGSSYPYTNNEYYSGLSSNRWANVYSVLGNFSGQITSGVAQGTAPFVIDSSTVVSKLNADYLDGYHGTDLVPKKFSDHFYPFIGASNGSIWYKVTFPWSGYTSSSNAWFMTTMELVIGGPHTTDGATGKIFLSYYFLKNTSNVWTATNVKGISIGTHLNDAGIQIKYDIANPGIFYIKANKSQYNGFGIENLTSNDTARNYNFKNTTIAGIAEGDIPTGATQIIPILKLDTADGSTLISTSSSTRQAYLSDSANENATFYPILSKSTTGDASLYTDAGLTFNASTNALNIDGITSIYPKGEDNTLFRGSLIIKQQNSSEGSNGAWDETKPSFGIQFNRFWTSGGNPYGETPCAGIFATVSSSWRGGLVFRTKNSTTQGTSHDISALILLPSGEAKLANGAVITKNTTSSSLAILDLKNSSFNTAASVWASNALFSSAIAGTRAVHIVGKADSNYNSAVFGYKHAADGSTNNIAYIGLWGKDNILNVLGSGNVGIGTETPKTKFHVSGGQVEFNSSGTGASTITTAVSGLFVGPTSQRAGTAGNYSSGIGFSHMLNYSTSYTNNSVQGWVGLRFTSTSGSELSALVLATKAGTSANDIPTERMCILPTGRIGINEKTPTTLLQITDSSNLSNGRTLFIKNDTFNLAAYFYNTLSLYSAMIANSKAINIIGKAESSKNSAYWGYHHAADGSNNNFFTVGVYGVNEVLNVFGSGNVAIGSTVSPANKLDVTGVTNSTSYKVANTATIVYNASTGCLEIST